MAGRLQVLQNIFCNFVNWDELEVYKNEYPAILTEQAWSVRDFTTQKIDFKNDLFILRVGKKANCWSTIKNMIVDYVFYVMTVFCCFLQLHCQHCPKIRNLDRPLHAIFFFFGDQSAQSRESKISPSQPACLEKPIRTQDSLLNVLGHCQ